MLHIAKLMFKQSLVWYRWFWYFINFSFDKMIFSNFQVSRDRERWLTPVRHSTLCGVLLEKSLSWTNENFTAVHVIQERNICFTGTWHLVLLDILFVLMQVKLSIFCQFTVVHFDVCLISNIFSCRYASITLGMKLLTLISSIKIWW